MEHFFMPMVKVDVAQRRVLAWLDETKDSSGEAMHYERTKPNFVAWSAQMKKASGGKSLGNVRAMHQLISAGKVDEMIFDDDRRAIGIWSKVVDDTEWQKVLEGVYTGISPGGGLQRFRDENGDRRYVGMPSEISLVDLPCNPNATFTMIKAEGGEAEVAFKPATSDDAAPTDQEIADVATQLGEIKEPGDYRAFVLAQPARMLKALFPNGEAPQGVEIATMEKKDYSADERKAAAKKGEAMPDGSFPIKTKKDLEDAIEAYGQAKDKAAAKQHIIERAKALKLTDELPADWDGSTKKPMKKVETTGAMKKSLGDVVQFTALLEALTWLASCVTGDATVENDGSPLPAELAGWISQGMEILLKLATEETAEVMARLKAGVAAIPAPTMEKALQLMAKAGARHSKEDLARVQSIHDAARDLGADCGDNKMDKAAGIAGMAKIAGELVTANARVATLETENTEMKKRLAQPAPGPRERAIAGQVIDRTGDGAVKAVTEESPESKAERARIEAMPDGSEKLAAMLKFDPTPRQRLPLR